MKLLNVILVFCVIIVGACSSSGGSKTDRRSVEVNGSTISWADYQKIAKGIRGKIPLAEGESIFLFSRAPAHVSVKVSNGYIGRTTAYGNNCHLVAPSADPNYGALFVECANTLTRLRKKSSPKVSLASFVRLAERAVKQEGSCQWLGYNAGFDRTVRAVGKAASFSDERLFFAKLKC